MCCTKRSSIINLIYSGQPLSLYFAPNLEDSEQVNFDYVTNYSNKGSVLLSIIGYQW